MTIGMLTNNRRLPTAVIWAPSIKFPLSTQGNQVTKTKKKQHQTVNDCTNPFQYTSQQLTQLVDTANICLQRILVDLFNVCVSTITAI